MAPRRLRLLQLVHGYPPAIGGVELSTKTLCERLVADYDVDVTVFTTNTYTINGFHDPSLPTIPIVADEEQNGVKIRRFPVETRWARILEQPQRIAWHLRLPGNDRLRTWYHGPISPQMLRAVREAEADVVCAASFPLNHLTYPFRHSEPRPPVVLVGAIHTNNAWGYDRKHLVGLTRRAFATVSHTEHERNWLVEHGAPADRVVVIGHGIELADFEPEPGAFRSRHHIPRDAFVVAYVGQQGGHKGIDTLVETFPRLLESREDSWLVVAGATTPYSPTLRALVDALPTLVRRRVVLLDDVSTEERAQILRDCDVFASPSAQEAFGITTLEAWSQARPAILGDSPAQRSIAEEGHDALLVPHANQEALLSAISSLVADPERRLEMGRRGHAKLLARYALPAVVGSYHELFERAARERSTSQSASSGPRSNSGKAVRTNVAATTRDDHDLTHGRR